MNFNKTHVRVGSPEEARLAMVILKEITGLQIHTDNITAEKFAEDFDVAEVGESYGTLTGWYSGASFDTISLAEFLQRSPKLMRDNGRIITIKLNDAYSAVVGEKTTRVGCQTFDNQVILELAEAIKKASK